ncbi:MAG: LrgB family protein [Pseudomonadota bacterium]
MTDFTEIWSYLAAGPLLWLTVTVVAYAIADAISAALRGAAIANPVLIAVAIVAALLTLSDTSYDRYFEGAQFIHFMLGPATVALAAPLYAARRAVLTRWAPILAALVAGSVAAIVSALSLAAAFGLPTAFLASLAPKSTTAPVAIGVAEGLGGSPTLTATLVIATGVIGAVCAPALLTALRVREEAARGLAIGVASHGVGAARAFRESERAGAFAGVGLGLNAVLTALIAPFILAFFV